MNRRNTPFTLEEATKESPTLVKLLNLSRQSGDRLKAIQFLIPNNLRKTITAGPIDDTTWCLIIEGNAAAAKLRQLLPSLQAHLLLSGENITSIRLKVKSPSK